MIKVLRVLLLSIAFSLCGCDVDLYTQLKEDDVSIMMARLIEKGIMCEKTPSKEGWILAVEKSDMPAAMRLLAAEGLPRHIFKTTGDLFEQRGLISSPLEDRIRFIYGLSQEIAETIMQIDGVLEARVHVVLPENDPLNDSLKPSSASVFVKYDPTSQARQNVTQIKQLVLNGIEGLTIDKVSVITVQGKEAAVPPPVFSTVLGVVMLKRSLLLFWLLLGAAFMPFLGSLGYIFREKIPGLGRGKSKPAQSAPVHVPVQQNENTLGSL